MSMDPSMLTQFGIMNSLKTGNMMFDMLLCMLIPAFFQAVLNWSNNFYPTLQSYIQRFREFFLGDLYRNIEYKKRTNAWGSSYNESSDNYSHVLQKAILLYISKNVDLTCTEGNIDLIDPKHQIGIYYNGGNDDDDEDEGDQVYGTPAHQIKKYRLITAPPANTWVEVSPGVFFKHSSCLEGGNGEGENGGNGNQVEKSTVSFQLYARGWKAKAKVEGFVYKAFDWYKQYIEADHKNVRYMYSIANASASSANSGDDAGSSSGNKLFYKRYQLSDEKTFKSLFFPQKEKLLRLVDNFMNRKGKYSIAGFPQRLGLLLYGPPGSGKTSLIKALAHYTNRHIVSISLGRIKTNQELYDIVFDQKFNIGQDLPMKHKYKQLIFVMEDIDCASDVVYARSSTDGKEAKVSKTVLGPPTKENAAKKKDKDEDWKSLFEPHDALNLSGILNVIDGVIDAPNRILIMTTNHPEKLDPALIRPGRVNMKLFLGYMNMDDATSMFKHYFHLPNGLSEKQEKALRDIMVDTNSQFTPAEVEQFCAEHESLDELLVAFKAAAVERNSGTSIPFPEMQPKTGFASSRGASQFVQDLDKSKDEHEKISALTADMMNDSTCNAENVEEVVKDKLKAESKAESKTSKVEADNEDDDNSDDGGPSSPGSSIGLSSIVDENDPEEQKTVLEEPKS